MTRDHVSEMSFEFGGDHAYREMLRILEDRPFSERLRRMFLGFSAPAGSGEYKFALLQFERLSAPFFGFLCVLLLVGGMLFLGTREKDPSPVFHAEVVEADPVSDLDEPPPLPPDVMPPPDISVEPVSTYDSVTVPKISDVPPDGPVSPKPDPIHTVANVRSPVMFKGIPMSRTPGERGKAIARYNGSAANEQCVLRALRHLATTQRPDGSWSSVKPAMTGLALLCYLAHGETPSSEEFGEVVERAVGYLLRAQRPDGTFEGSDGNQYAHLIATYALCEAYSMTRVPMLKDACEKALPFIVRGQHPNGGWDYRMAQSDRDDTSVMGWAAQAVKAGYLAGGLEVPGLKECFERIPEGFLVNAHRDGGFGYTGPSRDSGLTAVGVLCMQLAGRGGDEAVRKSFANVMDGWTLGWGRKGKADGVCRDGIPAACQGAGENPQYYAYYATQCMFQAGGERWKRWNRAMSDIYPKVQVVKSRETSGYTDAAGVPQETGYWVHDDANTDGSNRDTFTMSTALTCLQLEVYYRNLPTFREAEVTDAPAVLSDERDVGVEIELM